MPQGAAVFDFDRTLVRQETMAMFLRLVDGDALTGEMSKPSCTWSEKARRVKDWLAEVEGPF